MSIFCQRSYHRKCQRRGVGGQKSQNLVNVVCERPPKFINELIETIHILHQQKDSPIHSYTASTDLD